MDILTNINLLIIGLVLIIYVLSKAIEKHPHK